MKLIIDIPNEVLDSKHYCQYFGVGSVRLSETIENGIPYDPQGDCISRKALLDKLEPLTFHYSDSIYGDGISTAVKVIEKAQAVEPEKPKKIKPIICPVCHSEIRDFWLTCPKCKERTVF